MSNISLKFVFLLLLFNWPEEVTRRLGWDQVSVLYSMPVLREKLANSSVTLSLIKDLYQVSEHECSSFSSTID